MTESAVNPGGLTVKTPLGRAPVIPLAMLLIGGYLGWFAIHYWGTDVKWPSDPIKDVLQGKGLPSNAATLSPDEQAVEAAVQQLAGQQGVTPGTGEANPNALGQAVASGAASNQNIGKMLAASYGWSTGSEWDALVQLWDEESGWNNQVWNGGSTAPTHANPDQTAFGIPQALPYDKMPKAAWPAGYGGTADPTTQISWGLAYIKDRYGSPSAAMTFHNANGYY
jgi:hypothetical protein